MSWVDWLLLGIAVVFVSYLFYLVVGIVSTRNKTSVRSSYKSDEFSSIRWKDGKKQVYHTEDNLWLDYYIVMSLLSDDFDNGDSGYNALELLEEVEHYVGDYDVVESSSCD